MKTDIQQHLAACSINNTDSWKAFHEMNAFQAAAYGPGFDKEFQNYQANFFQHFVPYVNPIAQSAFSPSSSSSSSTSSQQIPKKKKPLPVPPELKDDAYRERRRRNNEAARKSREARRKMDNDNGYRVQHLEQENGQLKAVIQHLMAENAMMRQRISQQYPGVFTDPTGGFCAV
ncbi:hypothetical protein CAEBREN_17381 [Caenorhabditis brenneri]|uniref:BZIP domain-containing protein n=1 Tax=Caenorhabditis brenneri TaxID=135651 RepID=G0MR46_CAEBE|nr:hypothetical protein CAEBREN_17381 [Caenorhabditis brenneri]